MRTYETIVILDPDLSEEDNEKALKKIEGVIESQKGKISFIDHWGKRKLAYRVKKKFKGDYYRFVYYGSGNIIAVLERNLRITEDVYKFLTVKLSDVEIEITHEKTEKEKIYTSNNDDNDIDTSSSSKDIKEDDEILGDMSPDTPESDKDEDIEDKDEVD